MVLTTAFLSLVLISQPPREADDATEAPKAPVAPAQPPEDVLAAVGLTLSGHSYINADEVEAQGIEKIGAEVKKHMDALIAQKQSLENKAAAADKKADSLKEKKTRTVKGPNGKDTKEDYYVETSASQAKRAEANNLRGQARGLNAPIQADQDKYDALHEQYLELIGQAQQVYGQLANELDIRQALRELNKGRHPKVVLGPVSWYDANVVSTMLDHLSLMGFTRRQNLLYLQDEDDLHKKLERCREFWHLLARDEGSLAEAQAQRLTGAIAPFTQAARGNSALPSSPQAKAAAGTPKQAASSVPTPAEVIARRAQLLDIVKESRTGVDAIVEAEKQIVDEGEAKDCVDEINRRAGKKQHVSLTRKPGYKVACEEFVKLEAAIHTEKVALKQDGDRWLVSTHLQGKDAVDLEMVVDPNAVWTELPAALAKSLGLKDYPTTAMLKRSDGSTVTAQRGMVQRLELGPVKANDVICAVLPEELETAPAVLGGTFFYRYATQLDADDKSLEITRVDPPPKMTKTNRLTTSQEPSTSR